MSSIRIFNFEFNRYSARETKQKNKKLINNYSIYSNGLQFSYVDNFERKITLEPTKGWSENQIFFSIDKFSGSAFWNF